MAERTQEQILNEILDLMSSDLPEAEVLQRLDSYDPETVKEAREMILSMVPPHSSEPLQND